MALMWGANLVNLSFDLVLVPTSLPLSNRANVNPRVAERADHLVSRNSMPVSMLLTLVLKP